MGQINLTVWENGVLSFAKSRWLSLSYLCRVHVIRYKLNDMNKKS